MLDQPFAQALQQGHHAPIVLETASPRWAEDFRTMNFNEFRASPLPQSQFRREAPIQHTAPREWHQDFLRQNNPSTASRSHLQISHNLSHGNMGPSDYNTFNQRHVSSAIAQQKQPERQQVVDVVDQEAMERAFDAVSVEQHQTTDPSSIVDVAYQLHEMYSPGEIRIGSDKIIDESTKEEEEKIDKNDADELAKTAGQLLDNVKHDQSQKFQRSSFLSLMRQLRDREVYVEGDKLVDVSLSNSHS